MRAAPDPRQLQGAPGADRLLASGYQGAVYLRQTPEGLLVVKKASGRGLVRALRRAMLRREHAIYGYLHGLPGVPAARGLDADGSLLLEFIDGRSLRDTRLDAAGRAQFFAQLRTVIERVHAAGVAHGDLKRKDNILVGPGGQPYLVDFGTAIAAPPGAGWLRRSLWKQVCRIDLNAWVKLKYRGRLPDMTADDRRFFRPTAVERVVQRLRRAWRKLTLRRWRRRPR